MRYAGVFIGLKKSRRKPAKRLRLEERAHGENSYEQLLFIVLSHSEREGY